MNFIVLDLEFNQSYNFEDGEISPIVPECSFEIIQIGAVRLNELFEIVDEFSITIKPVIYPRLHPFVSQITKFDDNLLSTGVTFSQAYFEFASFVKDDDVLAIWGSNDMKELFRNIIYYDLDFTLIPRRFINVQTLASISLKRPQGVSIGLKNAVTALNIKTELEFHNALNDAIYTALVFAKVRTKRMHFCKYDISRLLKYIEEKKTGINVKHLFSIIETDLRKSLTQEEKDEFIKVYKLGQSRTLDVKSKF